LWLSLLEFIEVVNKVADDEDDVRFDDGVNNVVDDEDDVKVGDGVKRVLISIVDLDEENLICNGESIGVGAKIAVLSICIV
jgi:hypothetical protein